MGLKSLEIVDKRFWPSNFQPSVGKTPVCPHYSLIENAAEFAGTSPEDLAETPRFCGITGKGDFFGPTSTEWSHPETTCTQIRNRLTGLIKIANNTTPMPDKEDYQKQIRATDDIDLQGEIIDKYRKQEGIASGREKVIEGFRGVVFNSHVIHEGDMPEDIPEDNDHFRNFKSPDEISDAEALKHVEQALDGLIKVTGPYPWSRFAKGTTMESFSKEYKAIHCKQSPHITEPTKYN